MTTAVKVASPDPERQHLYEAGDCYFSIVNLTMSPIEADGTRATDYSPQLARAFGIYAAVPWELAVIDQNYAVEVLGRFVALGDAVRAMNQIAKLRGTEDKNANKPKGVM